jgi:hypothetical protein
MSSELHPELDRLLSRRFAAVAGDARVPRTAAALEATGIRVLRAPNAGEEKGIALDLIPAGMAPRSRLRGEWQPARPVRRRCREGHPRGGDTDLVRP